MMYLLCPYGLAAGFIAPALWVIVEGFRGDR